MYTRLVSASVTLTGYASPVDFIGTASGVFQLAMAAFLGVSPSQVALSVAPARHLLAGVTVSFQVSAVSTISATTLQGSLSSLTSNPAAFMVPFNAALAAANLPTISSAVFTAPTVTELVPPAPPSPAVAVVQPSGRASSELAVPLAVSLSGFFVIVAIIVGVRAARARARRQGMLKAPKVEAGLNAAAEEKTLLNFLQKEALLPGSASEKSLLNFLQKEALLPGSAPSAKAVAVARSSSSSPSPMPSSAESLAGVDWDSLPAADFATLLQPGK